MQLQFEQRETHHDLAKTSIEPSKSTQRATISVVAAMNSSFVLASPSR
jgi:hypothetical protein